MDTERFIHVLADDLEPVKPLQRPAARTLWWVFAVAMYLTLLIAVVPPLVNPTSRLQDIGFMFEQSAAVITGITAAFAALSSTVPGYRRTVLWWPLVSAGVWTTIVAGRALMEGPSSMTALGADWHCVPATLVGSAMPTFVIALMLRRGAPMSPRLTGALAALAAAGIGNIGICFFRAHHSSFSVPVWHVGTVFVLTALGAFVGSTVLRWSPRRSLAVRL